MSVERYINALPEPGRSRLEEIRRIAYAASPDLTEAIKYDMPVFYLDGSYLFYLGGWKTHAALYPIPKHYDFEDTISPYRSGKDTVKFPHTKPLPTDLIRQIVAERVKDIQALNKTKI